MNRSIIGTKKNQTCFIVVTVFLSYCMLSKRKFFPWDTLWKELISSKKCFFARDNQDMAAGQDYGSSIFVISLLWLDDRNCRNLKIDEQDEIRRLFFYVLGLQTLADQLLNQVQCHRYLVRGLANSDLDVFKRWPALFFPIAAVVEAHTQNDTIDYQAFHGGKCKKLNASTSQKQQHDEENCKRELILQLWYTFAMRRWF